jgi:sugar lactone lactonase YvrE
MTDKLVLEPFSTGHAFLDALRWHNGELWASDFIRSEVIRVDGAGQTTVVAKVPGEPSGLGFLPDDTPLVVSQHEQVVYRIEPDGGLVLHADLSGVARRNANDMVVRSDGSAYAGSFGYVPADGEEPRTTALAHIDANGSVSVAADGLMFPNGCVLNADETTLYVAETFAHCITAFDIGDCGELSHRRIFAELPDDVAPDGMCLDDEGALWMGTVTGERFLRVGEGGHVLAEIATPGRWAIGCVFGGAQRDTLFCTFAETTFEQLTSGVATAEIAAVRPGQRGAGRP